MIDPQTGQPVMTAKKSGSKSDKSGKGGKGAGGTGGVPDGLDDAAELSEVGGTTELNPVELENLLVDLFREADTDGSGSLDLAEFEKLMATANLGLSTSEVKLLLSEADENADGCVSYQEFVPLAVEVVQTMRLKARYDEYEEELSEEYRSAAMMIVGLSADEVATAVTAAVAKLNTSGVINKSQLKALLKQPVFGLSKQQVNSTAAAVTWNKDGATNGAALAEGLHETLVSVVAHALQLQSLGEAGSEVARVFEMYDKASTGLIEPRAAKIALLQGFPFTTRVQVNALISDAAAPYSDDGKLCWRDYLPKMTKCLEAMGDPAAIRERSEISARSEFQPVAMMSHLDRQQFERKLKQLFHEADADGRRCGLEPLHLCGSLAADC